MAAPAPAMGAASVAVPAPGMEAPKPAMAGPAPVRVPNRYYQAEILDRLERHISNDTLLVERLVNFRSKQSR
ncbi:hypothetical protein J8J27_25215, partial [Mycobacterium tuberculosis]|nr:hypothetical protein [Mycobacterium tuberculosis]